MCHFKLKMHQNAFVGPAPSVLPIGVYNYCAPEGPLA